MTSKQNLIAAFLAVFALAIVVAGGDARAALADRPTIKRMVVQEALRAGVPPSLALAVARVESNFDPRALSDAGARGVMQIMPRTARTEFGVHDPDRLWGARLNVRIGVEFLARLYHQYGRRWNLALSHYNGGTLKGRGAAAIPHTYTRKYVADVQRWQRRFERDATAQALVRTAESVQPAPKSPNPPAYWLYDEPVIERDWRDYLKIADKWLDLESEPDPELEAAPAEATPVPDGLPYYEEQETTALTGPARPSDALRHGVRSLRERFRAHLGATSGHSPRPVASGRFI